MKIVFSFFVASLFIAGACGWLISESSPVTDPILKRLKYDCQPTRYQIGPMKANETRFASTTCAQVFCTSDGVVTYLGCQLVAVQSHCKVDRVGDLNQYPHCCGVLVC